MEDRYYECDICDERYTEEHKRYLVLLDFIDEDTGETETHQVCKDKCLSTLMDRLTYGRK